MKNNRELRVLNRHFSVAEYDVHWTKLERYLFIEIYNVIKDFYMSVSADNINSYNSDSISLTLPLKKIDKKLFPPKNIIRDLEIVSDTLSKKRISMQTINDKGKTKSFEFINMFSKISYDYETDKENLYVKINSEIYELMMPIRSYALLDKILLSQFNSGNTVRLYEVFKSFAFRKEITVTFDFLRKQLGFFNEGVYQEWKYFNNQVLKKAVTDINKQKEFDIEVFYKKKKGQPEIEFTIITHKVHKQSALQILNLDEIIIDRTPSLIQSKYIESTLNFCNKKLSNKLNINELTDWVISDLVSSQSKVANDFDFKHSMNAISKQIRNNTYTRPFSHNHLAPPKIQFNEDIYNEIKKLVSEGAIDELQNQFSHEVIVANGFGYIF
jgi:hypothetical protein